jgi:hypothetical protein
VSSVAEKIFYPLIFLWLYSSWSKNKNRHAGLLINLEAVLFAKSKIGDYARYVHFPFGTHFMHPLFNYLSHCFILSSSFFHFACIL